MKKPTRIQIHLSPILAAALLTYSVTQSVSATDYYWDNDGATPGFGIASGTWAVPTIGNASQGWSTDNTGSTLPVDVTTTTDDAVFFGSTTNGLGAGTITVSGTVESANMNFASSSDDIIIDGGTIHMSANRVISVAGGTYTINSVLSGSGNRTIGGSGTLVLNGLNTFSGTTIIGNNSASSLVLRVNSIANAGAASSLGAGGGIIQIGTAGQSSTLELVGSDAPQTTNRQVRVGANAGGSGGATIRNNNADPAHSLTFTNPVFNQNNTGSNSGSNRTLTLGGSNTGDNTISGSITELLGSGVMPLIKTGDGTWILNGENSYDGPTTINGGILILGGSNSQETTTTVTGTGTLHLNSDINGGLPDSGGTIATELVFGSNTAVVQAINADRNITNRVLIPGSSNGAIFAGDFGISAGNLRLLGGAKTLTNDINPLKSLTIGSITANGNHNLNIVGDGVTMATGMVELGSGVITKTTGGALLFSTEGSNTSTNVVIHGGAAGGAWVAEDDNQHFSTGNFNLNDNSTLIIDYGDTTPSTIFAPLSVENFNIGTDLNLLIQGEQIASLAVNQSYPLVTWASGGPADGIAFTEVLTHRLAGTFSVSSNTLFLTVTANTAGPISWNTGNGTWDTTTTNWLDGSSTPTTFFDTLDSVIFGDAPGATGNPIITLDGLLSPTGVTMNSTMRDYTISGSGSIEGTTGITLDADNTRTLTVTTNNNYIGNTIIDGGTLSLGNGGVDGSLGGNSPISVATGAAFVVNQSHTLIQGIDFGVLSGNGNFVKTGGGTSVLTLANSYSGPTTIDDGTLQISSAGQLGNGDYPGNITIAGGSSLQYAGSTPQTISGTIGGAGDLIIADGGTLTLTGANEHQGDTIVDGTLNLANLAAIPSTTTIALADGAVLRPTIDGVSIDVPVTLGGTGTTAQINAPASGTVGGQVQTLTVNQVITGDGHLRLFGSANFFNTNATILLAAQSNYTGDTMLHTAGNAASGQNLIVRLATSDALPTSTVLTLDGGPGAGSGRTVLFDLNGFDQTLAGLESITTHTARNQRVTNTGSLATLTIHTSSDSEFGGNGPSSVFNDNPVNPSARIVGNLALHKSGPAKFTLIGTHEYTGNTTVSQGVLSVSENHTFNDASAITITESGATLDLNFTGSDIVGQLFIGTNPQDAGIYGAMGSGAEFEIPQITGTGTLTVSSGPGSGGYAVWAAANVGGQTPGLDFDNDGVPNGIEYFMNAAPGFTANPQLDSSNTITWENGGNIPASEYGTQFVVQTSTDLADWTDVLSGDPNLINTNDSLSYTLSGAAPRFVRLKVTPN